MLVAPGLSTTLPCLVDNKVGECRWSKAGKPVGMFDGKYEMRGDLESGDCSLTVYTVNLRIDDGQWQCQVTMIYRYQIMNYEWQLLINQLLQLVVLHLNTYMVEVVYQLLIVNY